MADQPIAVIDVGSNSGRCVVLRVDSGRHIELLTGTRVPLRLASAAARDGALGQEAIERTIDAVRDFVAIAARAGAVRTIAVATAAVRDAPDGRALVAAVESATGVPLEIIDGEREARCSFMGSIYGLPVGDGVVLDVGGGSVEVSAFRRRSLQRTLTLPLGSLRLSTMFLTSDPPSPAEIDALRAHVRGELGRSDISPIDERGTLVGTGGTVRNLAKMDQREQAHPITRVHGYRLARERVGELAELVGTRSSHKRRQLAGLKRDRVDSIVGGALVVDAFMEATGAMELLISSQGLREGLALEASGIAIPSPVEARNESVLALAQRFSTWNAHAARRRVLIAAALHDALDRRHNDEHAEMVRHAATVLDVGASVDYYGRARHAAAIALAANLSGFTHEHVAMLAAMLRLVRDDNTESKPLQRLLSRHEQADVRCGATVVAIADEFERRMAPELDGALSCSARGSTVTVRAPVAGGWWFEAAAKRVQRDFGATIALRTEMPR